MIHVDVEQNTDDWLELRRGKLTSSSLDKIMANYGKSFGEPAKKIAYQIIGEQISGKVESSTYTNEHIERGNEQEPIARRKYEEDFFCKVDNGGFFHNQFVGGSPDGLVGEDGLIEIKSVIPSSHIINIKRQDIDPKYKWQIMGNLKLTGRNWVDFISYCQNFPREKQLFVVRCYKSDPKIQESFKMIDERINQFKKFIEEQKKIINNHDYFLQKGEIVIV